MEQMLLGGHAASAPGLSVRLRKYINTPGLSHYLSPDLNNHGLHALLLRC
jgi:hypothetical protein